MHIILYQSFNLKSMLRKSFRPQSKKVLDVPPLVDSVTSEVIVSLTDPVTGEVSERTEFVTKCVPQSPTDAVRHEDAELYSIENLLNSGVPPFTAPIGRFISNKLDNFDKVECYSAEVCSRIADIDNQPKAEPSTNVVSQNPE